jgi:hypothetical protein
VIHLTVSTQDLDFPIASTEAVETLSKACADSLHAKNDRREFACASHKEGEVSEIRRYPTYPTGWLCPKCGSIYAPFVVQCMTCGVAKISPKAEDKTEGKQLLNEVA